MKRFKVLQKLINFKFKKPIDPSDLTFRNFNTLMKEKFDEINLGYKKFTGLDQLQKCMDEEIEAKEIHKAAEQKCKNFRCNLEDLQKQTDILQIKLKNVEREQDSDLYHKLFMEFLMLGLKEENASKELKLSEEDERRKYEISKDFTGRKEDQEQMITKTLKFWSFALTVIFGLVGTAISKISSYYKANLNEKSFDRLEQIIIKEFSLLKVEGESFWSKCYNATCSGMNTAASGITCVSKICYNCAKSGVKLGGSTITGAGKLVYNATCSGIKSTASGITWISKSGYNCSKSGLEWTGSTIAGAGKSAYNWFRPKSE